MLLTIQKSYELLAKYQFFAREICDTCGIVLGAVRFTRRDESGFGVAGNAEGMGIGERYARVDGLASTKQRTIDARENGAKTQ